MDEKLLPCPKCKEELEIRSSRKMEQTQIYCVDCGLSISFNLPEDETTEIFNSIHTLLTGPTPRVPSVKEIGQIIEESVKDCGSWEIYEMAKRVHNLLEEKG